MKKYLLDTNICIYFIKGLYNLDKKIESSGSDNCFISEITVAELKFGVENSKHPDENRKVLDRFLEGIKIIPIFNSLDHYAKEKSRLKKTGKTIDDFDLLIGSTAVTNNLTVVTNNIKHFGRIKDIKIENWTEEKNNTTHNV